MCSFEQVFLFHTTIRENIRLFRDGDESSLQKAVSDAQVQIDLNREIDNDSCWISSGEQRRIEIARSLFGSSDVLIYDEVDSTLDVETAYEIEKMALGFDGRTLIFISHNFSGKLIREYDKILIIEKGRLTGCGNFEDLLQSSAYFRRICDIKFGLDRRYFQ